MVAAEIQAMQQGPKLLTVEGRIPPHDLPAEACVLSSVLVDPQTIDKVADLLRPEHFYSESHRRIFEAVLVVHGRGQSIDLVIVATELRDRDRLAQVGGIAYLTQLLDAAPAVANVRTYAEIVRDKWIARQTILTCQRGTALGYADYGSATEYLQGLSQDLYELAAGQAAESSHTLRESLMGYMKGLSDAFARGATITGQSTGFRRYDRVTAGLHNDELTIIAARPGMGKTALVTGIIQHVVACPGQAGILFELEMPHEQITGRILCSRAMVDLGKVRTNMLTPHDWTKLSTAAGELANLPLIIDDQPGASLVDIRTKARRAATEAAAKGLRLALVVVDYLQLMRGTGDEDSREQVVAGIARGLKLIARELRLPVIALAQLNRACEERKDKRPVLSDLRESGAIEQDADNVVFVYRDEYYNKGTPDRGIAELIIGKQRNGPQGETVRVRFEPSYTRFDDIAEDSEEAAS